ncbi:hypothetical protein FRB94_003126 [Tulasnella sp. JGI-2019a]|nr:hypothetical protein FRB94_003126 [Tulasnella sp. JGI-2019a]KAG9017810.1 hypothetical protein FRB93_004621 [Tulasnella sp. JGI-2019a]
MSTTTGRPCLFRNAHNVPLKCFIQQDARPDIAAQLRTILEVSLRSFFRSAPYLTLDDFPKTNGAIVTAAPDDALIVLVDPPTSGGQHLIGEFGGNSSRAVLDFSWIKKCIEKGRCLGPGEGWGGHRLPVTNVNDFFSIGPSVPPVSLQRRSSDSPLSPPLPSPPYQRDREFERFSFAKVALSVPPRPILMQPGHTRYPMPSPPERHLYASPISHLDRGAGGPPGSSSAPTPIAPRGGVPMEWPLQRAPTAAPPVTASSEDEPVAPDASQIVMHHNGMGAKFTDADSLFIREYFRWSLKHHPGRTNRQILDCLNAKMPHHSVVSTAQYIRRHPDWFPTYIKKDHPSGPKKKAAARATESDSSGDMDMSVPSEPYDPTNVGEDGCPLPPKVLVPSGPGFRFTEDDAKWVIAFFNWYLSKHPDATRALILRELTAKASYRTLPSWSYFFHKNQEQWRPFIQGLRDMTEGELTEGEQGLNPRVQKTTKRKLSTVDNPDINVHVVSDTEGPPRWKPSPSSPQSTRTSSSNQIPTMKREDYEWDEGDYFVDGTLPVPCLGPYGGAPRSVKRPSTSPPPRDYHRRDSTASSSTSSSIARLRTHFDADGIMREQGHQRAIAATTSSSSTFYYNGPPEKQRRSDFGTRRISKPFTSEEKLLFIEFLADHPWVWTHASPNPEWLQGHEGTTAQATWQKFEKIQPHRSDACWREYHKRNAQEFDDAAKRLRIARETGETDLTAQVVLAQSPKNHSKDASPTNQQEAKNAVEVPEREFEAEDHGSAAGDYEEEDKEDKEDSNLAQEGEKLHIPPASSYSSHLAQAKEDDHDGEEMIITDDGDNGSNAATITSSR